MRNAVVATSPNTFPLETTRRIVRIQALTLIWMTVEAVVSLGAAGMARSPALPGFGGDSAVELLSAAVVLHRFYPRSREEHAEEQAAKIAGGLLFVLATFVAIASILALLGHAEARPSPVGIALLILAAVVMPWLATQKRRLSAATASAALRRRCCRVCHLWLSSLDCFGGSARQFDLEGELGRTSCCVVIVSPDCAGGMGIDEGQAMLRCGLNR
jgi:hypothetical protein